MHELLCRVCRSHSPWLPAVILPRKVLDGYLKEGSKEIARSHMNIEINVWLTRRDLGGKFIRLQLH